MAKGAAAGRERQKAGKQATWDEWITETRLPNGVICYSQKAICAMIPDHRGQRFACEHHVGRQRECLWPRAMS